VFDCGTVTCGVGCSCGDPQSGRCDCR
jgi:hypothetical protein